MKIVLIFSLFELFSTALGNYPPVDVVITWLNDTSIQWQEKFLEYKNLHHSKHPNSKSAGDSSISRYRDFFLLDYVVASCCINVPWIQNIHIIISDFHDPPNWELAKTDLCGNISIKFYTHRELLSYSRYNEEVVLPTFNSHVIELFIQFIPGLAEYFFSLNDDQIISKPLSRDQVFVGEKQLPVYYLGIHRGFRSDLRSDPEIPMIFTANSLKLVAELDGLDENRIEDASQKLCWSMHGPIFFKRDWLIDSLQKVGILVGITLSHHTRTTHDIILTMSLYPYYLLLYHPHEVYWITSIPFPSDDPLHHSQRESMLLFTDVEKIASMSTEDIHDSRKYQYLGIQDEYGELSTAEFLQKRKQLRENVAKILSIPPLSLQDDSTLLTGKLRHRRRHLRSYETIFQGRLFWS
jgi:hypothetical protein